MEPQFHTQRCIHQGEFMLILTCPQYDILLLLIVFVFVCLVLFFSYQCCFILKHTTRMENCSKISGNSVSCISSFSSISSVDSCAHAHKSRHGGQGLRWQRPSFGQKVQGKFWKCGSGWWEGWGEWKSNFRLGE